jgi:hypothetical protein
MNKLLTTHRALLIALLLGIFATSARNLTDPDVWWHLEAGRYIAQHRGIPHRDVFSYTRAGQPWVAHEWLSELAMYGIESAAKWAGLILFFSAVTTAALFVQYLRCGSNRLIAWTATLFSALATQTVWGVRPQMLSFFLTGLWLLILEESENRPGIAWWSIPVMLVWVNLHAGFALGLVLSVLSLAAAAIEILLQHGSLHRLRLPAIVLFLDFLVVNCNPNGIRMYLYPLPTLRSAAMQSYISEWFSPNFHRIQYLPFLLTVLVLIVVLASSRWTIRVRDLLFLLLTLYASLSFVRMIPIFILIAVPLISRSLGHLSAFGPQRAGWRLPDRTWANAAIIISASLLAGVHAWHVIERQHASEMEHFPSRAVSYLRAHPPLSPIFNQYDWGGYLIWTFDGRLPVFIDGRADVYGEKFLNDFVATYEFRNGWREHLAQWQIGMVFVPVDSPLAQGLHLAPDWKVAYQDSQAVIATLDDPSPSYTSGYPGVQETSPSKCFASYHVEYRAILSREADCLGGRSEAF